MTDHTDDGGPAFPGEQGHVPEGTWNQTWDPGMSLRDWFAGQALAGWVACEHTTGNGDGTFQLAADECYKFADAMLAERARKEAGL